MTTTSDAEALTALKQRARATWAAGDYDAVFDTFAPDFKSHVAGRVTPEAGAADIRPHERTYVAGARFAAAER